MGTLVCHILFFLPSPCPQSKKLMQRSRACSCSRMLLGTSLLTSLLQSDVSKNSPAGFAGGFKIYQNPHFATQPWQPSTVELQPRKSADGMDEDDPLVVFYFETNCAAGLASFREVATSCSKKLLPGECRNMTAVGGFATWSVPRNDVVAIVKKSLPCPPSDGELLPRELT